MKPRYHVLIIVFCLLTFNETVAQKYYLGNDLSYVNQMEDCGAVYKENMQAKDPFEIFADHGTNLIRVRLWIDPSWWQEPITQPEGAKSFYNDLEDVEKTIQRAKAAGMEVMLGLHYSDFWADPGRQLIPRSWLQSAYDLDALKDSTYNYTVRVLTYLDQKGLMPEIVKVGNENNAGILKHIPEDEGYEPKATVSDNWSRHAQLFNAAIKGVRDVGKTASINPKICIHFTNKLSGIKWFYQNIISNGVIDFDIMGFSYYYSWHEGSISELESTIVDMVATFPNYEIMVSETGYLWSLANFDSNPNIVTTPDPEYLPVSPEKQLEYMTDYTRAVLNAGGTGVVFWEPAWVITPCSTPWGQGSSHDHLVFFDPENTNFMQNGGGRWTEPQFYVNLGNTKKVSFQVNMSEQDLSQGISIATKYGSEDWKIEPMFNIGNNDYYYYNYLPVGEEISYIFLNGNDWDLRENLQQDCSSGEANSRVYTVPDYSSTVSFNWEECTNRTSPIKVTLKVDMTGQDVSRGVYIIGDVSEWKFIQLTLEEDNIYSHTFDLKPGSVMEYYFLTSNSWDNYLDYRETVPEECALSDELKQDSNWNSDRAFIVPGKDSVIAYKWSSCETIDIETSIYQIEDDHKKYFNLYPNPATNQVKVTLSKAELIEEVQLFDQSGRLVIDKKVGHSNDTIQLNISTLKSGYYVLTVLTESGISSRSLIVEKFN